MQGPVRLALHGFGHVGRALGRLLLDRQEILRGRYGLELRVTAILTGSHGFLVDDAGADLRTCLSSARLPERGEPPPIRTWPADILVEITPLNVASGQPALTVMREALKAGMDVVTANKGPIAHGFHSLEALAEEHGRSLRFEAAVADNLPLFNLVRAALPAVELRSIRGIFNSTTNYLLSEVSGGAAFESAMARAQELGIMERDPDHDLQGWDAAVKAVIINNVLLGGALTPADVHRQPVDAEVAALARGAALEGKRVRMVSTISTAEARWEAAVLQPSDPFYGVDGFSLGAEIVTDVAGRLVVSLHDPHVEQTAYALLADIIDVVRHQGQ
jgi:homoserine dehydrogenase